MILFYRGQDEFMPQYDHSHRDERSHDTQELEQVQTTAPMQERGDRRETERSQDMQRVQSLGETQHLLIVDDESTVRRILSAHLESAGYAVTSTSGAEEALLYLQHNPACDLVLSDIMMPEIDGLTLLDQIGADFPGLPVVMLTAVHDIHVATNAFRRGAVDYLLKPFERTYFLAAVHRAVEHGRLQRQNVAYRQNLESIIATRTHRLRQAMLDLERSYDITLETMGDALDLRDAETEGHSRRVTAYTITLARAMGATREDLHVIARGAFLHDIGKIAIPDAILLKPGKLTPSETVIMREHCQRGYDMVAKIPFLREASEIVYAHQESFDGSGYPRGLCGDGIPLGARIFAIADTLDAITSDRPYRKARTFEEARVEIAQYGGTQFDPAIVEVFLTIPAEVWTSLRARVQEGLHGLTLLAA